MGRVTITSGQEKLAPATVGKQLKAERWERGRPKEGGDAGGNSHIKKVGDAKMKREPVLHTKGSAAGKAENDGGQKDEGRGFLVRALKPNEDRRKSLYEATSPDQT